MVHKHVRLYLADAGMAVFDIDRIEGDRNAEHRNVLQAVPESSANGKTMF